MRLQQACPKPICNMTHQNALSLALNPSVHIRRKIVLNLLSITCSLEHQGWALQEAHKANLVPLSHDSPSCLEHSSHALPKSSPQAQITSTMNTQIGTSPVQDAQLRTGLIKALHSAVLLWCSPIISFHPCTVPSLSHTHTCLQHHPPLAEPLPFIFIPGREGFFSGGSHTLTSGRNYVYMATSVTVSAGWSPASDLGFSQSSMWPVALGLAW